MHFILSVNIVIIVHLQKQNTQNGYLAVEEAVQEEHLADYVGEGHRFAQEVAGRVPVVLPQRAHQIVLKCRRYTNTNTNTRRDDQRLL